MDWRTRVAKLERWGSYQAAAQYLEQVADELTSPEERADALFAHAALLDEVFLRRKRAADLFQQAAELAPSRFDALRRSRFLYRALGLLPQVGRSLERELGSIDDAVLAADLFKELGDVYQDMERYEDAATAYQRALEQQPEHVGADTSLADVSATAEDAEMRLAALAQAGAAESGHAAATLLVRAARMARRLGDAGFRAYLEAALRMVPQAPEPHFLLDSSYAGEGDLEGLAGFHRALVESLEDPRLRAQVATDLASRWLDRFQDGDVAAELLGAAVAADPTALAPHVALGQYWASREQWAQALDSAERALSRLDGESKKTELWLLSEATEVAWRHLHDATRAERWANMLGDRAPDHPSVEAFRREQGDNGVTAPAAESGGDQHDRYSKSKCAFHV